MKRYKKLFNKKRFNEQDIDKNTMFRKNQFREAEVNVKEIIKDVIDTDFGGSNEAQLKAVQLLKGLATSEDPISNKFMQDLNTATDKMDLEKYK